MPDCSTVTVTVPDWAAPVLTEAWGLAAEPRDGDREGARVVVYANPWGLNDGPASRLCDLLKTAGVPYVAEDAGHYTWSPSTSIWAPGRVSSNVTTVDGTIMADEGTVRAILDADDPEAALVAHFHPKEAALSWPEPDPGPFGHAVRAGIAWETHDADTGERL